MGPILLERGCPDNINQDSLKQLATHPPSPEEEHEEEEEQAEGCLVQVKQVEEEKIGNEVNATFAAIKWISKKTTGFLRGFGAQIESNQSRQGGCEGRGGLQEAGAVAVRDGWASQ